MNANEIQTSVLLGSHGAVKEHLAPVIAQVTELLKGTRAGVWYDGCGGVLVQFEANGSTSGNWAETYAAARKVRAALSVEEFRVTKPQRGGVDGGTFFITRDSFHIKVR